MLRSTDKVLFVAALTMHWLGLVTGVSLHSKSGGQQTDVTAKKEIAQISKTSHRSQLEEAVKRDHTLAEGGFQEEKAEPRTVLKKSTPASKSKLSHLQYKLKQKQEIESRPKSQYNKQMRKTLKGIKYEASEKTTTTLAPQSKRLKSQEIADENLPEVVHHDDIGPAEELEEEPQEDQTEEENSNDPMAWLHAGAEVEWNPMVGKKAKHLLKERDWIEVTVVDKEDDNGQITYGIQKGPLRTRVTQEQLRKPMRAKRQAEEKKREEAFWAKRKTSEAPSDGLEAVMIPLKAKVGRTCRGDPVQLGSKEGESSHGIDAEDCRHLCEKDEKCKFASHGLFNFQEDAKAAVHCVRFESCDETTGKGFRTWQKERMTAEAAHKARNSENLEDQYMAKIKEAEEVSLQRLENELPTEPPKFIPLAKPYFEHPVLPPGTAIHIEGHSAMDAQEFLEIPFWRHLIEIGAIVSILLMRKTRVQRGRKAATGFCMAAQTDGKEPNALFKVTLWIQREARSINLMLQRLLNTPKVPSDMRFDAENGTQSSHEPYVPERPGDFDEAMEKRAPMPMMQEKKMISDDDGVRADAPVNRAALRTAFSHAGNRRTADFR